MGNARAVLLITLLATGFHAGVARADANLVVGLAEDNLMGRPAETIAIARDLGVKSFRLSLIWVPGQTELDAADRAGLDSAVVGASGTRIVLAIYGERGIAPATPAGRNEYCAYVRNALEQYPQINDVVIWNEPNLTFYWSPQFNPDGTSAAPAAYQDLLARCWDVLHAFRNSVNLVGPVVSLWGNDNPNAFSNVSHSPINFFRKLGDAYRASGRTRPILDTFGHHPHPPNASERPWKRHESVYVSMGDWGKLTDALTQAFEGTAQLIPGQGPSIWWLEIGYQTEIDADKTHLYDSRENWPGPIPDFVGGEPDFPPPSADSPAPDQATQLIDSVRLSYCQPYVGAFFNFLLWDEPSLARWQSGVLWVDGTRKDSYDGFKRAIAEVNEGRVDCSRIKGGAPFIRQVTSGRSLPATSTPSGFFPEAKASALAYSGTRRGPFGFLALRGRLSAEGGARAGKEVMIVAGGTAYSATTDQNGVATVLAAPPLSVGNWNVQLRFLGDPEVRPASAEARVEVFNTPASVVSAGRLATSKRSSGFFRVSYDGRKLTGRLRFRAPGIDLRAHRFTALGVDRRGRSAWFTGFNRQGKRFWAYTEDSPSRGHPDRVRLWMGSSVRVAEWRLRSGSVKITIRRTAAGRSATA